MWTVTLHLRKNTRSGSAIRKELAKTFGEHYCGPVMARIRNGVADHLLEVSVSLPWNDGEESFPQMWSKTIEPLTQAISRALASVKIKTAAIEINEHRPTPGYRVELTFKDFDNYVTYYTFETETGKKQERNERRRREPAETDRPNKLVEIMGNYSDDDERNPLLDL